MDRNTTWRRLITMELEENKESWSDLVSCTLTEEQLDVVFDCGYGSAEGEPFTAWSTKFVYFPLEYDGSESCGSVSLNPNGLATKHQGG